MTSQFAEEDRELPVELPTASEARALVAGSAQVFITIDAEGTYYVDGQSLDTPALQAMLRGIVANHSQSPSVKIRADRRTECQALIKAMNLCSKLGIVDYSVATSSTGRTQ